MSNEQKLLLFMKKHGVLEDVARHYLSSNGWVLEQASSKYEADKGGSGSNPTKEESNSELDTQAFESLPSLSSDHKNRQGKEEEETAYFAGDSESSGQQILNQQPSKRVHIDDSTPALTSVDSDRSLRAWGHGVRLGSAHPINPPPLNMQQNSDSELNESEHTLVVLHLWSEGFSLDDGSLRPYKVPENERFLRAILRGDLPDDMRQLGNRIELSVQDHTNESFRHLSRKQFIGSGHLLGSPTPRIDVGTQSDFDMDPEELLREQEQLAESSLQLNENAPMTTVQLRLADGSRIAARFNLTHTISDIYHYVRVSRPQYASQDFTLLTAFPRQELNEADGRTIVQADLKNVVITQRIN